MAVDVVVHRDFDYIVGGGDDFVVKFLSFSTHNNTKRGYFFQKGIGYFYAVVAQSYGKSLKTVFFTSSIIITAQKIITAQTPCVGSVLGNFDAISVLCFAVRVYIS